MKFYITYFYNVRFLKPNEIPLSTAAWEPRWFHQGEIREFVDKRGVYCGLRAEPFLITKQTAAKIKCYAETCAHDCKFYSKAPNCGFMRAFREQLATLPKQVVVDYFNKIGEYVRDKTHFEGEPTIVLLVYEKPEVLCAERPVIVEWFRNNQLQIEEYHPPGTVQQIKLF